MNRRDFCKTVTTALIAWGLNPVLVLADNENKILNGEFFIDSKSASNGFTDLIMKEIEKIELKSN